MKYSIIIPTYNHCNDLLKPCIEAILKYTDMTDVELIVSANGCTDETLSYLKYLEYNFNGLGFGKHFKYLFDPKPLGYAKANNVAIKVATGEKIILLNNDAFLLPQEKNVWITLLEHQFLMDPKCGISGPSIMHCPHANHDFAIFFCVMVSRQVFDTIGLLSEDYGSGGGEDTECCVEAVKAGFTLRQAGGDKKWIGDMFTGEFPIWHRGEATVHDVTLVPDYEKTFHENSMKLAKKYNPERYRWLLSTDFERAVFLKGDYVHPREETRYRWASLNVVGKKILEIGCSTGYGSQFLPEGVDYTGLDYNKKIIEVAKDQDWIPGAKFINADINEFELGQYDTIIAFEFIEHIDNGLEIAEKLKKHCKCLLMTTPMNEPVGFWGVHHKLHGLNESHFPGCDYLYINEQGDLKDAPEDNIINLIVMKWPAGNMIKYTDAKKELAWLKEKHGGMYKEVIGSDSYNLIQSDRVRGKNVLDIGANVGTFSLLASALGAKRVVSIEPVSTTFEQLNENIDRSGFKNIIPIRALVTEESGEYKTISMKTDSGHNSMYLVDGDSEEVMTVTLKNLLDTFEAGDVVLKLDCEGAEYDIIMNATKEDMDRVSAIFMELHMDLHPKYKGMEIIIEKLTEFGFKSIHNEQLYEWYSADGIKIEYSPIPYRNMRWVK